jgi:hypothetical protein
LQGVFTVPLQRVTQGGKPGWRYGKHGKVYTYTEGSSSSERMAKRRAIKQGLAIQYRSGEKAEF